MRLSKLVDMATHSDSDPATREWGKAFADLLGVKNCDRDGCPIHGIGTNNGDTWLTQEDRDDLEAADLLQLAITSAADASNATVNGEKATAKLHQNQALIWTKLYSLLLAEEKAQAEAGASIKEALRREREQQTDPFEGRRKPEYQAPSEDDLNEV